MATVVRMPSVLANVTEGAIQSWLAVEGQQVAVGDPLAEIETEKAVVEYATEVAGTIGRLLTEPGQNVEVGTPIAVILAAGEGPDQIGPALQAAGAAEPPPAAAAPVAAPPVSEPPVAGSTISPAEPLVAEAPPESTPSTGARVFASPIVRRLARERGLELSALTGTGPNGRIVRRDLESAAVAQAPAPRAAEARPDRVEGAGFTDLPLTGMRRAIARRLTESKTTVPHFYVTAHVQVDRLLALRAEVNQTASRKISVNDFVVKAVAAALREVPAANAVWGGDHIRRFETVDIAVAVAVEGGLLTPVIRDADSSSISAISATVAELAERARAGRLQQHELEGGSFSISNLGMYGVDEFSAILNPPQSGILAVGAAKQRPVVVDGRLEVGTVMTVTLSADHRVIDGAVAAEWMAAFVRRIENPVSVLV
ncbi:pyruvate dehydrogenase complex dihydrolipoamide acetyltransferase [Lysinimonas soli]|uniref:Acetyltransferase component of pyruvate dehydrogenase complex n=1 Tax=Lysinimonas soli TaxID=1074233 RepID=A0ABW0NTU7_9MICO